jgi:single-strand DNA-binding protein
MPGMNKITVGGYVSRDPEVRVMPSGDKVCNFSIPTSEKWTDKQTGEAKEETTWHNIVVFNSHLIDNVIEPYVKKGSQVVVLGKVRLRTYQDQQGVEKLAYEVEIPRFGSGELHLMGQASGGSGRDSQYAGDQTSRYGKKQEGGSPNDSGQGMTRRPAAAGEGGSKYGDLDDDIPF